MGLLSQDHLVQDVIDFHRGQGRFGLRGAYLGMEASSVAEVFLDYFETLGTADKGAIADIVLLGALGRIKLLCPFLAATTDLLVALCIRGQSKYFLRGLLLLEQEFTDRANLEQWAANTDAIANTSSLASGVEFKQDWHYALSLWTALRYLGSESLGQALGYLVNNARSEHFRAALMGGMEGWFRSFEDS